MKKLIELCKYIPLLIVIPFLILSFFTLSYKTIIVDGVEEVVSIYYLQVDESFDVPNADIIIVLLPMIFTIIAISLSLPAENICGVKNTTFRRTRKDCHFSFIEMILITICVFCLYTLASIFSKTSIIWMLDFISVIYSVIFVCQEIPLLIQDEKYILKIVRKNWINEERNLANGKLSKTSDLKKIVQYIILSQGIKETYRTFSYKKKSKEKFNAKILDDLLSINNEFLFDCLKHKEYLVKNSSNDFNGIDLQKSIEVSLDSLIDIFVFNNDFNICKIYGDSEHYYQVTRMIFSLKTITNELLMNTIFQQKISKCMQLLSYSSIVNDSKKEEFKNKFIVAMLKYSISDNELWFIRLLRDSEFYTLYSNETKSYVFFISIYFYYIMNIDTTVPKKLKDDLQCFFREPSEGVNSNGINWNGVLNYQIEYASFDEIVELLPKLLKIYGEKEYFEPWYCPESRHMWSSDEGVFDKALIVNCWIELLVYSYQSFDFQKDTIDKVIDSFDKNSKEILAYELSKNWFKDKKFIGIDNTNSYLSMYNARIIQRNDGYCQLLIDYLFDKKNSINLDKINNICNQTDKKFDEIKKTLIVGFNNKRNEISVFNENLIISSNKLFYYSSLIENNNCEQLIRLFIDSFKDGFEKIINQEFSKNVKSELLIDVNKTMESIDGEYEYRSRGFYDLFNLGCTNDIIKKIFGIEEVDLWLPDLVFFKNGAIKFNIKCDENKSFVRNLNSNEINNIIDKECKVTEGLYKFNIGDDYESVFVDRSKIYEMIGEKYLFACIVFKYEVSFDSDKIKWYVVNKKDDENL